MRCPHCGRDEDRVVDSRPVDEHAAVRRRRECRGCATRFTTFERIEQPEVLVRKRSGALVAFSRHRVLDGMARASKGRVPREQLEQAARSVEFTIRSSGETEVSSEQVGLRVLAQLRDLDEVSYLRFASVYKDFQGPEEFALELNSLRKEQPPKPAAGA